MGQTQTVAFLPTGPKTKVGLTYIAKVPSEEPKVGEIHMAKTKVG